MDVARRFAGQPGWSNGRAPLPGYACCERGRCEHPPAKWAQCVGHAPSLSAACLEIGRLRRATHHFNIRGLRARIRGCPAQSCFHYSNASRQGAARMGRQTITLIVTKKSVFYGCRHQIRYFQVDGLKTTMLACKTTNKSSICLS